VNRNEEEADVGARKKLSSAAFMGSLMLASGLGCLTNSWRVLIVTVQEKES
jgi:hypothetical protein